MRHFEERLNRLRRHLLEMGGLVESAVHTSVQALIEANTELARHVLAEEPRINELEIRTTTAPPPCSRSNGPSPRTCVSSPPP